MNHFVPDFETDDDYVNVTSNSSSLNLPRKPFIGEEDDLMELLWHNGQVILQNQRPINTNKPLPPPPPPSSSSAIKLHGGSGGGKEAAPPPPLSLDQNLFIQEDEMTSWLQYPLREDDFCSDLLFSTAPNAPCAATSEKQTTTAKPPVPSVKPPVRNFTNFSRLTRNLTGDNGKGESSKTIVRDSTQIKPSPTPSSAASISGVTRWTDSQVTVVNHKGKAVAAECEIPGTSSSVASKNEIEPEKEKEKTVVDDDRKRKATECHRNEENKQEGHGSSAKRSRAAQVHNLSERKRRDRINERMKALQELIPRCNKSDKASMLDEAIEYMKSLQLQIQMMSMGCGMMPMMYMPHMAMGMGMGMNMNQPLPPSAFMPFPNMLAAQRPLPGGSGSSRVYVPNQHCDPTVSSQPQYPGYIDPYQQYHTLHPAQPPQFQNEATSYPSSSRVSSNKESKDQGNHPTG